METTLYSNGTGSICLGRLGDNLKLLVCMHLFHTACIESWLKITPRCPICNMGYVDLTGLPKDNDDDNNGPRRRKSNDLHLHRIV